MDGFASAPSSTSTSADSGVHLPENMERPSYGPQIIRGSIHLKAKGLAIMRNADLDPLSDATVNLVIVPKIRDLINECTGSGDPTCTCISYRSKNKYSHVLAERTLRFSSNSRGPRHRTNQTGVRSDET